MLTLLIRIFGSQLEPCLIPPVFQDGRLNGSGEYDVLAPS
jgi:hypothetical protein